MIKYFNTVTNERGDALNEYRVQVVDSSGAIVPVFEDAGGTRFTANGVNVDYATTSVNGRVAFYWEPQVGQVLQTLSPSGNLVYSEADFANALAEPRALPRPEWFGGAADFVGGDAGGTGTDNKAAIEACLAEYGVCYLRGDYGVSGPINMTANNQALIGSGCGTARIYTLPNFTGADVIHAEATRVTLDRLNITVTTDVFDPSTYNPASPPAVAPDGITTSGLFYHQYIRDCRVFGGRRNISLGSLESKPNGCVFDNGYDGVYIAPDGTGTAYDQSLINVTTNNSVNYGVYSERGIEATDLHIVRAGETGLRINAGTPCHIVGLFIDTPTKDGIHLIDCNGGVFEGVYFTKVGEGRPFDGGATTGTGTTPDHDCRYIVLERSRDNEFLGSNINFDPAINQDQQYFLSIDDGSTGLADTNRSIRNQFRKFRTVVLPAFKDTADQRKFARWQRWTNNTGTAGRLNNEGYAFVGETLALGPAASRLISFPIPNIDLASGGSFSIAAFEYSLRDGSANRVGGTGIIPIVQASDTGGKDGAFTAVYTEGSITPFTITGVTVRQTTAGNRTTSWLEYTVTNPGATTPVFCHQVHPILDNQGPL